MVKHPFWRSASIVFLIGWFLIMAGCAPVIQPEVSSAQEEPFRPPTPVGVFSLDGEAASETPVPDEAAAGAPRPTATVPCSNNLVFLADLTIPDGSVVAPEATLDKRWEVQNSGTCNWNEQYRVRLIAGSDLGAQREQALFPARGDSRVTIRIVFKAPLESGTYRSAWQAFDPQGEPFGDPFFVEISVR